jgi:hypothetical protein
MTVTGTLKNGVIIFPPGTALPEGANVKVEVEPLPPVDSFLALVKLLAKPRPHLPADYALNRGFYIRGEPKKS